MVRDAVGILIYPQFLRGPIVQIILYNTLILTSGLQLIFPYSIILESNIIIMRIMEMIANLRSSY